MTKHLRTFILLTLGIIALTAVVSAGAILAFEKLEPVVTHVFFTDEIYCDDFDPPREHKFTHEGIQPGDEVSIKQFITNICRNTIRVKLTLNGPTTADPPWIHFDRDDRDVELAPGNTMSSTINIRYGNNTPPGSSATFKFKSRLPPDDED